MNKIDRSTRESLQKLNKTEVNNLLDYVSIKLDVIDGIIPYCEEDPLKMGNCNKEKYIEKNVKKIKSNESWHEEYRNLFLNVLKDFQELRANIETDNDILTNIRKHFDDIYLHMINTKYTTSEELTQKRIDLSVRMAALRKMNGLEVNQDVIDKLIEDFL
jgi:hypothetical protein